MEGISLISTLAIGFGVALVLLLDGSFEGQRTSRSGRDMPDALVCLDWVRFELAMGMGYRTLRASRVLLVLRFYRSRA